MTYSTLAEQLEGKWVIADSGCWLWIGALDGHGYGKVCRKPRMIAAHRAMYELHRGPIPDGLVIDHVCCVRHCVNPEHMQVVTAAENSTLGKLRRRGEV